MGIISKVLTSGNRGFISPRVARDNFGVRVGVSLWILIACSLLYLLSHIKSALIQNTWIEYTDSPNLSEVSFLENFINNFLAGGIWLSGGAVPTLIVILFFYSLRRAYQYWRHQYDSASRDNLFQTVVGFVISLCAFSAFANWQNLPWASWVNYKLSGGVIGLEINSLAIYFIGKTPAFLLEFIFMIIGVCLIFRISILKVTEYIGTAIMVVSDFYIMKKSELSDRSLGEFAKKVREETLMIDKKNLPNQTVKIIRKTQQTDLFSGIVGSSTSVGIPNLKNNQNIKKDNLQNINITKPNSKNQQTHSISSILKKYRQNNTGVINNSILQTVQKSVEVNTPIENKSVLGNIRPGLKIIAPNIKPISSVVLAKVVETNQKLIKEKLQEPESAEFASTIIVDEHEKISINPPVAVSSLIQKIKTVQSDKSVQTVPAKPELSPTEMDNLFKRANNADFERTLFVDYDNFSELNNKNKQAEILIDKQNDKLILANDINHDILDEYLPNADESAIDSDEVINEITETQINDVTYSKETDNEHHNSPSINYEQWRDFPLPPIALLDLTPSDYEPPNNEVIELTSKQIESTLKSFGVSVHVAEAYPGPVITSYYIELAQGVKGTQIINLSKDLARSLAVNSIRVVDSIPGKTYMGLEVPNKHRQMVKLAEILSSEEYHRVSSPLTLAIGKDISGVPVTLNLGKMPHLLVAGTTGSGKSVGVNDMILSMLYKATPNEIRLVMIDPKMVELSVYDDIPHLLAPVITDMKQAVGALTWCVAEMERRQELLASIKVRNLMDFNKNIIKARQMGKPLIDTVAQKEIPINGQIPNYQLTTMPFLVVIVDEYADLFMVIGKKVEELIARLAQKGRACGIHIILATQRPSVDVVTGLIKANIPTRIAFQVSSKIDSRTIIDQMGAESLLGQGDMLYYQSGRISRMHGAFVSDEEVNKVADYLRSVSEPKYLFTAFEDPTEVSEKVSNGADSNNEYDQAVAIVIESRNASISYIQRRLSIGFNKAAKIIEKMEEDGVVSAPAKNGKREVLSPRHY